MKILYTSLLSLFFCAQIFSQTQCDVQINDTTYGGLTYLDADFMLNPPILPYPFTYQWILPDSSVAYTQTVQANLEGNYCVTATDSASGCSAYACFYYEPVGPCPSLGTPVEVEVVSISDSVFLASGSGGLGSYTYQWSDGSNDSILYTNSTGQYCVTITDVMGCSDVSCFTYVPSNGPCVVVDAGEDVTIYNSGLQVQLGGNPTALGNNAPFTYTWSPSPYVTSNTIANPFATVDSSTCYSLTVTDAVGCQGFDTVCVTVDDTTQLSCYAVVYPSSTTTFPALEADYYSNSPGFPNNTQLEYLWNTGDSGDILSVNDPGVYCVTITNILSGCVATQCYYYNPNAGACDAAFLTHHNANSPFELYLINLSDSNLSYIWDFGDGNSSTDPYPSHTYVNPGVYTVCVTAYDTNINCTSTFCDSIGIDSAGNFISGKLASGFTLNVISDLNVLTSVSEQKQLEAEVYPNPIKETLNVSLLNANHSFVQMTIYDLYGKQVFDKTNRISQNNYILDLSVLPKGIYILSIVSDSGNFVKQIVKQ